MPFYVVIYICVFVIVDAVYCVVCVCCVVVCVLIGHCVLCLSLRICCVVLFSCVCVFVDVLLLLFVVVDVFPVLKVVVMCAALFHYCCLNNIYTYCMVHVLCLIIW